MAVVDGVSQDTGTHGDGDSAPIRVLVVDDHPEIAALARTFLERADDRLAVTVATSAPSGLDLVRERQFDVVVSDYHMPAMDGLALLDRVAEVDPGTPGILFSSDASREVDRAAREAEVPYVHKRMGSDRFAELARHIRAAVRNRRG